MAANPKAGSDCKMYRNTGTYASPTWGEISEVGDVSIPDLSIALAEMKRRANAFTKNLPSLIQTIKVNFKYWAGMGTTIYSALLTDFFARTPREYAIMNGSITVAANQGLRLPAVIEAFPKDEALEDVSGHDAVLACAYLESAGTEVDPVWYTVP